MNEAMVKLVDTGDLKSPDASRGGSNPSSLTSFNIIADIAGQYDCLLRLLPRMPDAHVVLVGDLVDRGPKSKSVLQFAKILNEEGTLTAIMGNHEHMMLDFYRDTDHYGNGIWKMNGGDATDNNFLPYTPSEDLLNWVENLPRYLETPDILITHAGVSNSAPVEPQSKYDLLDFIWNRCEPVNRDKLQVFGHNSHWGLKYFGVPAHSICLDQSQSKILTGLHWPSMQIFEEKY